MQLCVELQKNLEHQFITKNQTSSEVKWIPRNAVATISSLQTFSYQFHLIKESSSVILTPDPCKTQPTKCIEIEQ